MVWKKGSLPTSFFRPRTHNGNGICIVYSWSGCFANHIKSLFISFLIRFSISSSPNSQNKANKKFFSLLCVALFKEGYVPHKLLQMLFDTQFVDLLSSSLSHFHAPLMVYQNPMQIFHRKKTPNDQKKRRRGKRAHSKKEIQEVNDTWGAKEMLWIGIELSSNSYK